MFKLIELQIRKILFSSGNRIKQLAAGSLEAAKHMRALYLANNRIEQVHKGPSTWPTTE
jgi:hypothetical protein